MIDGLPTYLDERDLEDLFSAFGRLKSFQLRRDPRTGESKGCAYCEYFDPAITDTVCTSTNGMMINGNTMVVRRVDTKLVKLPDH
uniref:RRM domain-containing protein n=1 Tax=Arcella intermedia TaxID=1963864 RepID=A0A6B2LW53_9EUKA